MKNTKGLFLKAGIAGIALSLMTAFALPSSCYAETLIGLGPDTAFTESKVPDEAENSPAMASPQTETGSAAGSVPNAGTSEDDSWQLILVNRDHPIPDDYVIPELTQLSNGNSVDSRIYPALQQMFDDARAQGIYPHITSSFRTTEKQQELMDQKIAEYTASGYSEEDAKRMAEEWVAIPGTSEHQLGLSVDISVDESTGQDAGSVWYWLQQNCHLYGFIQRYPENKTDITGIINEPWHYRYVGTEAAAAMHESGQCLEEYLAAKGY